MTYDLVGVHDCLQTVRDRQKRHVLAQLRPERLLDDRVRLVICALISKKLISSLGRIALTDRRRRLVQNKQLAPAHDRAREREDLALADGQVRAAARDLGVERDARVVRLVLQVEEPRGAERGVQDRVGVL